MTATDVPTQRPRISDDVISTVFTSTIAVLAVAYTTLLFIPLLVAWEVVAVTYLVVVFVRFRNRSARQGASVGRLLPSRTLEYLSWALPLAASATGVASAVALLTSASSPATLAQPGLLAGVLCSIGVVVAWLLLQTGFAEIYETVYQRLPDDALVAFPGTDDDPTLSDFLYLAFTIGTSFSPSGVTVASRKVRRVVLLHSVAAFFYNAFLIAIAIQVLQNLIASA